MKKLVMLLVAMTIAALMVAPLAYGKTVIK